LNSPSVWANARLTPVITINSKPYGDVTAEKIPAILERVQVRGGIGGKNRG
jgi:hypothetical protein